MADNIQYAADDLLGANTFSGASLFEPVRFPSGMSTRSYASLARSSLDDTVAREKKMSSSLRAKVEQGNAIRELEAQRSQDSALAELHKLDPLDSDFDEKTTMFLPLAADSEAVRLALAAKQHQATKYNSALTGMVNDIGMSNLDANQTEVLIDHGLELLKAEGPVGQLMLAYRANLKRRGLQDEHARRRTYQTPAQTQEQKDFDALEKGATPIIASLQNPNIRNLQDLYNYTYPVKERVAYVPPELEDGEKKVDFDKRADAAAREFISTYNLNEDQLEAVMEADDFVEELSKRNAPEIDYRNKFMALEGPDSITDVMIDEALDDTSSPEAFSAHKFLQGYTGLEAVMISLGLLKKDPEGEDKDPAEIRAAHAGLESKDSKLVTAELNRRKDVLEDLHTKTHRVRKGLRDARALFSKRNASYFNAQYEAARRASAESVSEIPVNNPGEDFVRKSLGNVEAGR